MIELLLSPDMVTMPASMQKKHLVQVVAYEKVEEDHWPERIYVERTRGAIERAAHQFHLPDDASTLSGCIDLLQVGSPAMP